MKFTVTTASCHYTSAKAQKLISLGFEMEADERSMIPDDWYRPFWRSLDHAENTGEVEINTLEELMAFVDEWGDILLDADSIQIYDAWRHDDDE